MTKSAFIFGRTHLMVSIAFFGLLFSIQVQAALVSGGSLILNLDRDALIAGSVLDNYPDSPTESFQICCRTSIYVEEFWDASAASKTFNQLRVDNTPDLYDLVSDEISAIGLEFSVNADSIPVNPSGRTNRPTTFNFDPNDILATAQGKIGLNGVIRFRVDVSPPTNRILVGDMTLEYHPELEGSTFGRSGWLLVNHIGFDAEGFELFDVTTKLIGNVLTLQGNVGFGEGLDHVGATDARLKDTRIGTFSFQTTVIPLPPAVGLFLSGLLSIGVSNRLRHLKKYKI